MNGTNDSQIEYKTHKTHGAKSEKESMSYYHQVDDFADFFVGLISYNPFEVFIIPKRLLPRHPRNNKYIKSPFKINIYSFLNEKSEYINCFNAINVKLDKLSTASIYPTNDELLPITTQKVGINTSIVVDSILRKENFRIWDMSIRGFARETIIQKVLSNKKIKFSTTPQNYKTERGEKADLVVFLDNGITHFVQVKGLSVTSCFFNGEESKLTVETQLTRGRVNDHPTQSRLYRYDDFDFLMLGIDPAISYIVYGQPKWSIFLIPSKILVRHKNYPNRYKSHQYFTAKDLWNYLYAIYD